MDGTLVDSIPFHKKAWLKFLSSHGINLPPEEFLSKNRGNLGEMMRLFFGEDTADETIRMLGEERENIYRDLYGPHVKEIEGLIEFLDTITGLGIKASLATMGDSDNISFIIDKLNVRPYFSSITGGHEIRKGKPDAEIYELSLKKLNLKKNECIVIEDSMVGISSARRAGIEVVGITTSFTAEELKSAGCIDTIPDYRNVDLLH